MNRQTTDRSTYGFLDFLGDLGGLAEILKILVRWMCLALSSMRLNAIMINRLYHISDDVETTNLIRKMRKAAKRKFFCDKEDTEDKPVDWTCKCNLKNPNT
jgi:hypothetical protein